MSPNWGKCIMAKLLKCLVFVDFLCGLISHCVLKFKRSYMGCFDEQMWLHRARERRLLFFVAISWLIFWCWNIIGDCSVAANPSSNGTALIMDSLNQFAISENGRVVIGDTTHYQLRLVIIKIKFNQSIPDKVPRQSIISLLKINFKDHTTLFALFKSQGMEDFLGDNDAIYGVSTRNEANLVGTYKIIKEWPNSSHDKFQI